MSAVKNFVTGKTVNAVYVGGKVKMTGSSSVVKNGFKGCVKVGELTLR